MLLFGAIGLGLGLVDRTHLSFHYPSEVVLCSNNQWPEAKSVRLAKISLEISIVEHQNGTKSLVNANQSTTQ